MISPCIDRCIKIAVSGLAILFIWLSFNSPVNWDQANFYGAAETLVHSGTLRFNVSENTGEEIGLWHPPLYIYLMALSFKIFGVNLISARLVGAISLIISLLLIRFILKSLYPEKYQDVFIIALLLTGLSPYVIQGTVLLDIDNTILTTLMLLFLYIYIRHVCLSSGFMCHLLLALLFAILLWAKFTTPFIIPVSIFIYHVINKRIKLALHGLFTIGGIGIIVFLLSFWVYCHYLNLPFEMAVHRNLNIAGGALFGFPDKAYEIIKRIGNFSFWLSPFYIVLLIINLIWWVRRYLLPNPDHPVNFIYLIAYLSFLGYLLIRMDAYYYPRYVFPSVILINLLISEMVHNYTLARFEITTRMWLIIIGIILLSAMFYLIFLKDPLLEFNNLKRTLSRDSIPGVIKRLLVIISIYLIPLVICAIILKFRNFKIEIFQSLCSFRMTEESVILSEAKNLILILLISGTIASNMNLNIVQARADYSRTYFYGESGFWETVRFLKDNLKDDEFFASRNLDLAVMSGKRYYFFDRFHPENLSGILKDSDIDYLVLRDEFYHDGMTSHNLFDDIMAKNGKVISENYTLVARYGFFRIYKKIKQ